MKINYKKSLIYFLLILVLFILDRLTKLYVLNLAETNGQVNLPINNFLNIILVWNTGIGFGLFSSEDNTIYNFITLLILMVNFLIIYLIIKSNNFRALFYLVILGGSLGNLFDRLYYSAVPDFIDLNYKGFHWFIFNLADIFITFGIFCLICFEFLDYKKGQNVK
tara:strand:+ start:122 stop:616 length:495 start_codon:yes stop_codon:yes gene_type:complete